MEKLLIETFTLKFKKYIVIFIAAILKVLYNIVSKEKLDKTLLPAM